MAKQNEQKVAVVSGALGYVGSAISATLASAGFRIAALYHDSSEEDVRTFLAQLPGSGHQAYQCDLEDSVAVGRVLDSVEKECGTPYACIHAAGTLPKRKQLHLSTVEDLREQFEVNVFGSFNFLSACAARLKSAGRGVLIGITTASVVSQTNTKARGAYSPMKFAVQGMLVALREELAPFSVRVYSVAPGVLPGGLNKDTPAAFLDMFKSKSPTKTLASASDVAEVVSSLCSGTSAHTSDLTVLVAPEAETSH